MANLEKRKCAWEECQEFFFQSKHNQIYHTDECCKKATNARIMRKYHERKARRAGAKRVCRGTSCNVFLSRYNDSQYCAACELKTEKSRTRDVLEALGL